MTSWSRLLTGAVLVLSAACAHVEAPTGGPEIRDPLELVAVRPDSLSVLEGLRGPVVFEFERRLSERGLEEAVLVSPRTSPLVVSHSGRQLRVALRNGWEPGQVYHVTVLPTFQDLWNNRPVGERTVVFSTGPAIPETRLGGRVTDRITGRPELEIRVEAIRAADSLVYATRTDSAGAFNLDRIPPGEYNVRAFRDMNRNRALDPFEPRDTTLVQLAVADSARTRLRVVAPDTTPPVPQSAELRQGVIQLRFDDHLDPLQPLDAGQVEIVDTLGNTIRVARLAVGQLPALPVADTVPAADAPAAAQPPQPALPAAPPAPPAAAARQEEDDEEEAEPLPSQTLAIEPADSLAPGMAYTVRVVAIVNVVGLAGDGEVTLRVAELPARPAAPEAAPAPEPADDDAADGATPAVPGADPDAPDAPDAAAPGAPATDPVPDGSAPPGATEPDNPESNNQGTEP
jgi:hypothetical protein